MRSRASEFPNDNASLHRGAVWVTTDPCAAWQMEMAMTPTPPAATLPRAIAEAPTVVAVPATAYPAEDPPMDPDEDESGDDIEIVDELEPLELDFPKDAADPFAQFVGTLVQVAEDAGCERATAILPALLDDGVVVEEALSGPVRDALLASGLLARRGDALVGGEVLRATAAAWRAILRGDSEDFSACGARMLDEWSADLVARLVAAPSRTESLRRELRARGVAAFGLVLAA